MIHGHIIGITGCPATGKKTVGSILALLLGYRFVDSGQFLLERGVAIRRDGEIEFRGNYRAEMKSLTKNIIVTGLFIPELVGRSKLDYLVVLRCAPPVLYCRYVQRNYDLRKVRDNLTSEYLDYCLKSGLKLMDRSRIAQLDTTFSKPEEIARNIRDALITGDMPFENVDWLSEVKGPEDLQMMI
ncbi:MAG: AAA family ATPase [Nitrososphaerota archaeon]|jgi:broad-specificity NMP kinase|nr:AAA family ATPase [Nitrososphaerota archaeon]MDG7036827.1 AAA family ATPase [Nitrososphaerota archaeon]MDG7039280.1 AAA family ATPase [Nitrososphaerota archaeon]